MDMELALQNSFEKVFPYAQIRSCYFHYVKALWSHAANFGLKKKHSIKKTRQLIQSFKIACHMKRPSNAEEFIKEVNRILIVENGLEIAGEKTNYKKFFAYVKKTYFTPTFPFAKYIYHSRSLEDNSYQRTNNFVKDIIGD